MVSNTALWVLGPITSGRARVVMLGGVALGLAGLAGQASANPALAEQLRKSQISNRAAGATTVADQLAIRRFGSQTSGARTVTVPGVVFQRGNGFGGYCPPGWQGGQHGRNDFGLDPGFDRVSDGWNPDHYDRKPFDPEGTLASCDAYGNYINVGFGGSWGRTRFVGGNAFLYNNFQRFDNNRWWWDPFPYGVDGRLVNGIQPGSQLSMPPASSAVPNEPAPEPETDIEAARRELSEGDFAEAVERYQAHLQGSSDEFETMAELGMALAGAGRLDDAAAMMRLAYAKDPGLASRPLNRRVTLDSRALRGIVVKAVRFAHDRESASAWLLVTVLMQAEDRDSVGMRMIDRAADRGLPAEIVDPLRAAMRS